MTVEPGTTLLAAIRRSVDRLSSMIDMVLIAGDAMEDELERDERLAAVCEDVARRQERVVCVVASSESPLVPSVATRTLLHDPGADRPRPGPVHRPADRGPARRRHPGPQRGRLRHRRRRAVLDVIGCRRSAA